MKQAVIELAADPSIERVLMLTQPRVLGYVFNPVSFYWCYRADGSLGCMVSELNNTFGERLPEVLRGPELRYEQRKRLHVSPFFGLDQTLRVRVLGAGGRGLGAHPRPRPGRRPPLTAVLHGRRRELTNRSLAALLLRYPLQPLQVTTLIHLQALRLWLKRVPFNHKPPFVPGEGSVRAVSVRAEPAPLPQPHARARGYRCSSARSRPRRRRARGEAARRRLRRFGSGAPVRLEIHDAAFFRRLATRGKLGLGESYTAGEWDTDDLVALFELLLRNVDAQPPRHPRMRRLLELRPRLHRRNGLLRARRNIAYHYDLGNELFALMLDETMMYSCAVFERPGRRSPRRSARSSSGSARLLELDAEDHVLEIGCGWGGFARYAAERHGCRVTGITISREQAALARERTRAASVEILEQDYRRVEGAYTKIVSIEMIEAIGADLIVIAGEPTRTSTSPSRAKTRRTYAGSTLTRVRRDTATRRAGRAPALRPGLLLRVCVRPRRQQHRSRQPLPDRNLGESATPGFVITRATHATHWMLRRRRIHGT